MSGPDDQAHQIDPGLAIPARPAVGPRNPFNPGFGTAPPRFAGRGRLIGELVARVEAGPGRHDYHNVIIGPRGVGKTVLLNEVVAQGQARNRWVPIHWNASLPLRDALDGADRSARRALQGMLRRGLRRLEGGMNLKAAPGGVGAEARIRASDDRPTTSSTMSRLQELGGIAAARHATIIIVADELQAASSDDLHEIVAAIQQLANTQRLPVALLAAGLSSTRHLLRSSEVSPGFAERLIPITLDNLDDGATRDALQTPIHEAGRDIDAAALDLLVATTRGYPFAVQLAGHAAWTAAGDAEVITVAHARAATKHVDRTLDTQLYGPRWNAMSRNDKIYVAAAAALCDERGVVASGDIARSLGRTTPATSQTRQRLIDRHHVLVPLGHNELEFSIPGFADWVRRHVATVRRGSARASRDHDLFAENSPSPPHQP